MSAETVSRLRDAVADATRDLVADDIAKAASLLAETRRSTGTVVTAGNGGSSSTASHFAADLVKFTRTPGQPHFRALCLTDNVACHTAWTNDDDPRLAMAHLAEPWVPSGTGRTDAAVLFSVHGGSADGSVSNNLVELARYMRAQGGSVIAVTGFDGGELGTVADVHINVALDAEPIATPGVESVHLMVAHALCLALSSKEI